MNMRVHRPKGIGGWRRLYLKILDKIDYDSIIDIGAGSADFLTAVPKTIRRIAIDGGNLFEKDFLSAGIDFRVVDLDCDPFPKFEPVDVAVCSDVFEHLLWPRKTLAEIATTLGPNGILISHVPNEFSLIKTVRIMFGLDDTVYFHRHCDEWENPHLRRFSDVGYRRFLEMEFPCNLRITSLRSNYVLRSIQSTGVNVPYALQMGPTYISTKSNAIADQVKLIIRYFEKSHSFRVDLRD